MDEMRIKSAFLTKIVAKLVRRSIRKSTGLDIPITLDELVITSRGDYYDVKIGAGATLTKHDLLMLVEGKAAD